MAEPPHQLRRPAVAALAVADTCRGLWRPARPQLPAQGLVGGVATLNIIAVRLGEVRVDDGGLPLRFDR